MFGSMIFMKTAGKKLGDLFKGKKGKEKLEKEVSDLGLDSKGMDIVIGEGGKISVTGKAVSQEMKERILIAIGNVDGVSEVEDGAQAGDDGVPSQFHQVVKGDTLWAVSKKYYGKGSRYPEIFEANRPMLSHPDKIYVGQVLRIPSDGATASV